MGVTKKDKLLVETRCDLCGESMGTSLIDPEEYGDWLKHTTDLLTFDIPVGSKMKKRPLLLCWDCIKARGLVKEYDRRLNDLTYPREKK